MRGSFVSSKETLGYPLTNLFTEDGVRGFILSGGNLARPKRFELLLPDS
jgi:hypothetical protein